MLFWIFCILLLTFVQEPIFDISERNARLADLKDSREACRSSALAPIRALHN